MKKIYIYILRACAVPAWLCMASAETVVQIYSCGFSSSSTAYKSLLNKKSEGSKVSTNRFIVSVRLFFCSLYADATISMQLK